MTNGVDPTTRVSDHSPTQTMSARELNHDVSRAKRAAAMGPVVITERGRPSHVLLTIADYERLREPQLSLADALAADDDVDLVTERDGSRRPQVRW